MSLFDSIKENFGLDELSQVPAFRGVIYGDYACYFEGISGIKSYSSTEIVMFVKKGLLTVKGEKLYIKKFCSGDVVVCGKILSLERA